MKIKSIFITLFVFTACSIVSQPADAKSHNSGNISSTSLNSYQSVVQVINNGEYLPQALALMSSATHRIYLIMYAFEYSPSYGPTYENALAFALSNAKARGIDVKVILDSTTTSSYPATTNFLTKKIAENAILTNHIDVSKVCLYEDDYYLMVSYIIFKVKYENIFFQTLSLEKE